MVGFDLIHQPWIGVLRPDGTPARVGLREALAEAHRLDGTLAGHLPTAASALMRVLTVLAYRVTRLHDRHGGATAWRAHKATAQAAGHFDPDAVDAYLAAWATRFDLFDQTRPWLQDPRLNPDAVGGRASSWSGLNKLLPGRPADNSPPQWGPWTKAQPGWVSIPEAIDGLMHTLFYGPAGQCTNRFGRSGARFNSAKASPLRGYLSVHPTGGSLFDTLLAHMVYPTEGYRSPAAVGPDEPPWEADLTDPEGQPPAPGGILGTLVGRARLAVLLHPADAPDHPTRRVDDACVTVAFHKVTDNGEAAARPPTRDPFLPARFNTKGGWYDPVTGDISRAVWRDLDAILADPAATASASPAATVPPAALVGHTGGTVVYAADQARNQSVDRGWLAVPLPVDLAECRDVRRVRVVQAVSEAESVGAQLAKVAKRLESHDTPGTARPPSSEAEVARVAAGPVLPERFTAQRIMPDYWARAALLFDEHIDDIMGGTGDPLKLFGGLALRVFDDVADTADGFRHLPRLLRERHSLAARIHRSRREPT